MIEIVNNIIETTLNSFDFAYCIIVNLLTYFAVSIINKKSNKDVNTWTKRIILLCVIFSTGVVYYLIGSDTKVLFNSAILSPVFWSWIMKPVCKYFKIDYKQLNIFD